MREEERTLQFRDQKQQFEPADTQGLLEMVKYLVEKGAHVNGKTTNW